MLTQAGNKKWAPVFGDSLQAGRLHLSQLAQPVQLHSPPRVFRGPLAHIGRKAGIVTVRGIRLWQRSPGRQAGHMSAQAGTSSHERNACMLGMLLNAVAVDPHENNPITLQHPPLLLRVCPVGACW